MNLDEFRERRANLASVNVEHRSRPLIDAIVAVGVADIIAGLEVELIWAAGDVQ